MSPRAEKALSGLITGLAGLSVCPEPTIQRTAEGMNGCLAELIDEILGEHASGDLFEKAVALAAPRLKEVLGITIVSTTELQRRATTETDDLLTKLRKGGL